MHMDLEAIVGEAIQIHVRGQGAVDERALAHEALVVLQDAIQLVKVLHQVFSALLNAGCTTVGTLAYDVHALPSADVQNHRLLVMGEAACSSLAWLH